MATDTNTNTVTFTVEGRAYNLHLDQGGAVRNGHLYRITGTRKADGSIVIYTEGPWAGRFVAVGISHLEKVNTALFAEALRPLNLGVAA